MKSHVIVASAVVCVLLREHEASAQYGTTAVVDGSVAAVHDGDPTASGTSIDVDDRYGAFASSHDVVRAAPGARVVESGGFGSFSSVAIRGADLTHTTVLLGDMPLRSPTGGVFDLSLVPGSFLERVDVYRGGAPVWLSEGGIGGVVRLVPRLESQARAGAVASLGSFGSHAIDARASSGGGGLSSFASVGLRRWAGDFPFVDDRGTRFDSSDDIERRRQNAEVLDGHGLVHARARSATDELDFVVLGVGRRQGEPGPASSPALQTRRARTLAIGTASWTRHAGSPTHPVELQMGVGGSYSRDQFTDRFGEIGLVPAITDDRAGLAHGRVALRARPARWLDLTTVTTAQTQVYRPDDVLAVPGEQPSDRQQASVAVETRLFGRVKRVRVELRPSVRLGWSHSRVHAVRFGQVTERTARHWLPTYRIGALVAPASWLTVNASVAHARRLPTVLELFGNRATLRPNPDLVPESALSADAGVTIQKRLGALTVQTETRGFLLRVDDLIRLRRTSQFTAVADNVETATVAGIEQGIDLRLWRHVHLTSAATWTRARDALHRVLPLRPRLVAQTRATFRTGRVGPVDEASAYTEFTYTGANFVDPANLVRLPSRTWVSTGVRVVSGILAAAFTVQDAADARGSDLLGFPLPGRRYVASLSIEKELGP